MVKPIRLPMRTYRYAAILAALLVASALTSFSVRAAEDDPVPNGAPPSEMQRPEDNLSNTPDEENPPMPPSPNGSRHGAGYDAPPPPHGASPPPPDGNFPPPPPPRHGDQGEDDPPLLDNGDGNMREPPPPPPPPRNHP